MRPTFLDGVNFPHSLPACFLYSFCITELLFDTFAVVSLDRRAHNLLGSDNASPRVFCAHWAIRQIVLLSKSLKNTFYHLNLQNTLLCFFSQAKPFSP